MTTVILWEDGKAIYSASVDQCKQVARRQGQANSDRKHFRITDSEGVSLLVCHYEPGKRLLWLWEPAAAKGER